MGKQTPSSSAFDVYARSYDAALQRGLVLSGESKEYFARERVRILSQALARLGLRAGAVMDFGCGTGGSIPYLRELPGLKALIGVDPSTASLAIARQSNLAELFFAPDEVPSAMRFDLVFSNGVFHHISPSERPGVLEWIHARMTPGACFALWENNPWNLGTRWVMSRIPFDRDAIMLSPRETRNLLQANGFCVVEQTAWFYFPSWLRFFRRWEPRLSRILLGAQYLTLAVRASQA